MSKSGCYCVAPASPLSPRGTWHTEPACRSRARYREIMSRLRRWSLAWMAVAVGILAGCSSGSTTAAGPPRTTPTTAETTTINGAPAASRLLAPPAFAAAVNDPRTVAINVHVPFAGALPGTDLFIPYDQIRAQAAQLPAGRSTPLAIYCRSGRMSSAAAPVLAALGYRNIVELGGGMDAWQSSGRSLLQQPPK